MKNKTVIIYKSKYGCTQKYAQWLADEIGCEAYEESAVNKNVFSEYETIIFGGGLYVGSINGISTLTKHWEQIKDKNIVVFTVGISDPTAKGFSQPIIDRNFSSEQKEKIKFFHLRGGINYKKLGFVHKPMINMLISMIKKRNDVDLTEDDKVMIQVHDKEMDFTDRAAVKPIYNYVTFSEPL